MTNKEKKRCPKCATIKDLSAFKRWNSKKSLDGYHTNCTKCREPNKRKRRERVVRQKIKKKSFQLEEALNCGWPGRVLTLVQSMERLKLEQKNFERKK